MKRWLDVVRRRPIVFPLALFAAAVLVFISEGSYWRSVSALDELGQVAQTRLHIQDLERALVAAETGQRGYLLTGSAEHLVPYERALTDIDQALRWLEHDNGALAGQGAALARLHDLIASKLAELALTVRLNQQGQRETSLRIVASEVGTEEMTAVRALTSELLRPLALKVTEGRKSLYLTLMLSRAGVAVFSLTGLLALLLYLRQAAALKRQQLEVGRVVQAERDRLEVEVGQRTEELTELTRHLLTAREDERNRLARNLHDELGALLTSAKLDAARIKSRLSGGSPEALDRLGHLVETLNSSIALGRRIVEDLRPSTLSNLGLVATLEILAREFAEVSGLQVHCAFEPVRLAPSAELVVYRLMQEAITNIGKYAQAAQVWLTLAPHDGQVRVSVRDDGIGFDTGAKPASAYGLLGMRFRVEAERGTLSLRSELGVGTLIQVTLPESVSAAG